MPKLGDQYKASFFVSSERQGYQKLTFHTLQLYNNPTTANYALGGKY